MPRNYQRKTARKSRRAKLAFGAVRTGDDATLTFDWGAIEGKYKPLPPDAKEQILEVCKSYIAQDKTEHDAPYFSDALSKLSRLNRHATALLNEHRAHDPADRAVLSIVETRMGQGFRTVLAGYVDVLAETQRQLREDSEKAGFTEGCAWRSMIWRLLDIVEEFGLPSTVAKPSERTRRPSLFVAFVAEIQKQLPSVHWAPPPTRHALAAAIANVRRKRKDASRRQEVITPPSRG